MRVLAAGVALISFFALLAQPATAADWLRTDTAYSAIRTLRTANQETVGPVYYDSGKERVELSFNTTQWVVIRRADQQSLYKIVPSEGVVIEGRFDDPDAVGRIDSYVDLEPETLGRTTLNGETVTIYRVATEQQGEVYTAHLWATDDGIAMRIEGETSKGHFAVMLSDLERGPQPKELFELPDGLVTLQE